MWTCPGILVGMAFVTADNHATQWIRKFKSSTREGNVFSRVCPSVGGGLHYLVMHWDR